jgi:heat shock protein HslJ
MTLSRNAVPALCVMLLALGCTSPREPPIASDSAGASDSARARIAASDTQPAATAETFRAVGQEPGWLLTVSDSLRLGWDYDARRLVVATPTLQMTPGARTYAFMHQDTAFTVRITDVPCADAMSGHEYPSTVVVHVGTRLLEGCGARTGELLQGGEWRVDSLDGSALVQGATVTLQFLPEGSVTGSVTGVAGCNRYCGRYALRETVLTVGATMSTRMACTPAIDRQEARFLAALAGPLRFYIENGALHLTHENSAVVVARRAALAPPPNRN